METFIWLFITVSVALLFAGIGIFAIRRKKPMWFWSGSEVSEYELTDVKAYNKANGIMWLVFSLIYWISAILGLWQIEAAGVLLFLGTVAGVPVLIVIYGKIYKKYKR